MDDTHAHSRDIHKRAPALILLSPLQMETVTKILIKMHRLSTDGAIWISILFEHLVLHLKDDKIDFNSIFYESSGGPFSVVITNEITNVVTIVITNELPS